MKFLCLHGMGGSARILEAQTSRITRRLRDDGHEFVFIDGSMDCEPPPTFKTVYPPDYLSFYKAPIAEDVQEAIDYVSEVIEDEGPFDGVLGFSQGCCVATALMFQRQKLDPSDTVFRCGIFVGASLPFDSDNPDGLAEWVATRDSGIDEIDRFAGEVGWPDPLTFPDALDQPILGRYHPKTTPDAQLKIPILHVIGRNDPFGPQGRQLALMHERMEEGVVFDHEDGHEVPRDTVSVEKIAQLSLNMIARLAMVAA